VSAVAVAGCGDGVSREGVEGPPVVECELSVGVDIFMVSIYYYTELTILIDYVGFAVWVA
jgi:hypothetical protein